MDDMVVTNEGVKRRLPLWMLGDQAGKSETSNVNDTRADDKEGEEDEARVNKCGRKLNPKLQKKGNENCKQSSSTVLMRCLGKNQTRREVITIDAGIHEEVPRKKRETKQKKETCLEIETDKDVENYLENEETEDLTVEDLMSIAKEYVEEDNNPQVIVSSKQKHIAGSQTEDVTQSGSSLNLTDTNRIVFESQGISSCTTTENQTCDTGLKPTLSGASTQDILDIFLGPFLNKTQEKEKRLTPEYTSFTYEVKEQQGNVDVGKEPVVVAKKKGSLKDKVAMFLD